MKGIIRHATFVLGLRVTQVLVRTAGFRHTVRFLGSVPVRLHKATDAQIADWVTDIEAASGRPKVPSCLDRSVFLWFVMRLHRRSAALRIGIATTETGVDGHAWVEDRGVVLNDAADITDRFLAFDGDPIGIAFS